MRLRVLEGGTPGVIYGPGDIGLAHAIDEHVRVEEVLRFTAVVALTIAQWCGIQ
jgi:acetylornithine deacetylase